MLASELYARSTPSSSRRANARVTCVVRVEDYTLFGANVQIYSPMHPFDHELRRKQE